MESDQEALKALTRLADLAKDKLLLLKNINSDRITIEKSLAEAMNEENMKREIMMAVLKTKIRQLKAGA